MSGADDETSRMMPKKLACPPSLRRSLPTLYQTPSRDDGRDYPTTLHLQLKLACTTTMDSGERGRKAGETSRARRSFHLRPEDDLALPLEALFGVSDLSG